MQSYSSQKGKARNGWAGVSSSGERDRGTQSAMSPLLLASLLLSRLGIESLTG